MLVSVVPRTRNHLGILSALTSWILQRHRSRRVLKMGVIGLNIPWGTGLDNIGCRCLWRMTWKVKEWFLGGSGPPKS